MLTGYINWNPAPEIFSVGSFALRWYGLLFAMSFIAAYLVLSRIFPKEGLTTKLLDSLTLYVGIGAVLGARLGHCLFYQPEYYLSNPIEILKVWEGGLASHGGALGILIALLFFELKHKQGYLRITDLIVITVPLAGMFIRLGNLMNSEIIGQTSTVPWAFVFIRANVADPLTPRHPAQLYEAIAYLLMFFILMLIYRRTSLIKIRGMMLSVFLFMLFSFRFFIEFLKEDQVSKEAVMSLNIGQKLSIPFALLGLAGMILLPILNKRKQINKINSI